MYAVVPAIIAGLFTLAPKGYEIITEPKTSLSYTMVSGPKISIGKSQQQVLSLHIQNSGSKTLKNVKAELQIATGSLEAISQENNSGLILNSAIEENKATISTSQLHPGENFSISALVKISNTSEKPTFTLRSDEVLGEVISTEKDTSPFNWKIALSAAAGVFLASFLPIFGKKSSLIPASREDIIFYIASITDTLEAIPQPLLSAKEIYYARYGDLLLRYARTNNANLEKSATALHCLLAISNMSKKSADKIERNLQLLLGEKYNQTKIDNIRQSAITLSEDLELREKIYSISLTT